MTDIQENTNSSLKPAKRVPKKRSKIEACKVTGFDKNRKTLNISFKGYGIQLTDVDVLESDYVKIKYVSDIGKSDFTFEFLEWVK